MAISELSLSVRVKHPRLMFWALSAAYLTGTLRWLRDPIISRCISMELA